MAFPPPLAPWLARHLGSVLDRSTVDGLPPGPALPVAVQTALYLTRPAEFLAWCTRRYGDIVTLNTLLYGVQVGLSNPRDIQRVFTADPDVVPAGDANRVIEPVVGPRSVVLLDGREHIRHRRLLMPPFHGERMLAYAETMREVTEQVVDTWPSRRTFALHPSMQRITLDIILRAIFGAKDGEDLTELREALARLLDLLSSGRAALFILQPLRYELGGLSPWASFLRLRDSTDRLVYRQIARRRAEARAGTSRGDDVLSMLLDARDEQGSALSDVELRDELMTLLIAGHETTATMLCWTFDLLLSHPRVYARLEDELRVASGNATTPPLGDLARLPYLDAVIKEVLRLRPVVPAVGRHLTKPMEIANYRLPSNTLLVLSSHQVHLRADVYPEPHAFRPERFLGTKPDPYAWFPFGGGARRCLAMAFALYEMKIVVATVMARAPLRKKRPLPSRIRIRTFTFAPERGVEVERARSFP